MYQVTVKGESIEELKKAVADVHAELNGQSVTTSFRPELLISKSLLKDDKEEMEEVKSPYSTSTAADEVEVETEGELDSEGIPWIEEIHASSKNKNKDGTWREKRSVSDELVKQVKARYLNSAPVTTPDPVLIPDFAKSIPVESAPVVAPVVTVTPAPVAPPMPTMSQGHSLDTFKTNFHTVLATLITEGKITQEYVNQLKTYFAVDEIWKASDEQKAMCFAQWCDLGFIQKVG